MYGLSIHLFLLVPFEWLMCLLFKLLLSKKFLIFLSKKEKRKPLLRSYLVQRTQATVKAFLLYQDAFQHTQVTTK